MQTKKGGEGSVEQDESNCKNQKNVCWKKGKLFSAIAF